ncbi:hypothetical protein D3C84_762400 [compost metagenome]
MAFHQWAAAPLVVAAQGQAGEDAAPQAAGAHAIAAPADAVVDVVLAAQAAEDRQAVIGAVDGAGPAMGQADVAELGIGAAQVRLGELEAGRVLAEHRADARAVGNGAGTLAEGDAAIAGSAVVIHHEL